MLTTHDALAAVLDNSGTLPMTTVPMAESNGRVLRQIIKAERDQPPFDRVMMDGIALAAADYNKGQRRFTIQALQAAGDVTLDLSAGHCIEIMTGAARPNGADCIVPVERIRVKEGIAEIDDDYDVVAGRFFHERGSDFARNAHLLTPGKRLSPLDIAIIASCNETHVDVAADPVVRIVSTGNELVAAGAPVEPHQVRLSNGPALHALLSAHRFCNAIEDHIIDDLATLRERLALHLEQADVLILSGGVSMGKADYVPAVLEDLRIEQIFHKVSQRPGKPMWFGKAPGGQLVFALPGNPVSALVCCRQYVVPALAKSSGLTAAAPEFAVLAADITFQPDLTCFQPVQLVSSAGGQVLAMPVRTNTSGDFASLSGTDGYVELPREQSEFPAGTAVFLHRWIVP